MAPRREDISSSGDMLWASAESCLTMKAMICRWPAPPPDRVRNFFVSHRIVFDLFVSCLTMRAMICPRPAPPPDLYSFIKLFLNFCKPLTHDVLELPQ